VVPLPLHRGGRRALEVIMTLYEQIYLSIKKDIQSGLLKSGQKLPSKRRHAFDLGVSINTVDAAYSQLQSEGYIIMRPKSGCYVAKLDPLQHIELTHEHTEQKNHDFAYDIDFSPSDVDTENFPYALWRKLLRQNFDEIDPFLLKSPDYQGDIALRTAICAYLSQSRNIEADPQYLVIGNSTAALLRCICGMLGNTHVLASENPVYNTAYSIFSAMGGSCISIDAVSTSKLVKNLEDSNADIFYVTPSHQFPLGHSLPLATRIELLNWAAKDDRYIIEDDYDSEFRYSSKPLLPIRSMDKNGKVIYIGTFSKSISPSLKLSYALLPPSLMKIFREKGRLYLSSVSRLEQNVVHSFMSGGYFERHLNRMRNIYRKKRQHLVSLLSQHKQVEILGENAGHHILIRIKGLSESQMVALAKGEKIRVYPVSSYFIGGVEAKYESSVLLGYGALSEKQIGEGVARLMKVWGV